MRGETLWAPESQAALREATRRERDQSIHSEHPALPVIPAPSEAQSTTIPCSRLGCILNQATTGRLLGQDNCLISEAS